MKIKAGRTLFVIIVLLSFHKGSQDIFGHQDQDDAGHKSIKGVKAPESFPLIIHMAVDHMGFRKNYIKTIKNQKDDHGTEKDLQQPFHIPGVIKYMLFFHKSSLILRNKVEII
jgi:hypothetical protein